jgi:external thioesterase TEII
MQIFLLHFAGGNKYSFDFLKGYSKSDIQLFPLELPGRGQRFGEPFVLDIDSATADYVNQIKSLRNDDKYLIYGHSMGATIGLFTAKKMEDLLDPPEFLIVSGNAGPGAKETDSDGNEIVQPKKYLMNDEDFKEELRKLGGIPEAILESEEMYDFFSTIIRADFEVLEKEDLSLIEIEIKTPIHAMMGDSEKKADQIENWKNFTSEEFSQRIFEGNHFFIHSYPSELMQTIIDCAKEDSLIQAY